MIAAPLDSPDVQRLDELLSAARRCVAIASRLNRDAARLIIAARALLAEAELAVERRTP